jgi:hypothetical protein
MMVLRWVVPVVFAVLLAACGDSISTGPADQLRILAEKAEADAVAAGAFRDTGYVTVCRQGSGYPGGIFEQIGFNPTGDAAKHEYCYNVSDDRKAVGLSARSSKDYDKGLCIISRLEGGTIIHNQARAMGEHEGCFP